MKKYNAGLTLIELVITLAIVAIVSAIAVPSMQDFVKNERLTGQINTLISHLNLAKSEALKRNQTVVLCTSSDSATCTNSSGEDGWIVIVDVDGSGSQTSGDEIIKIQQALTGDVTFNNLDTIVFDSRGFSPNSTGTFTLCDDRGTSYAKVLSISRTGRVRRSGTAAC